MTSGRTLARPPGFAQRLRVAGVGRKRFGSEEREFAPIAHGLLVGFVHCVGAMASITLSSLGEIARRQPSAARVFLRHHLDFCCGGRKTLSEACAAAGLDAQAIAAELEAEAQRRSEPRWEAGPVEKLADHIVARYHIPFRKVMPPLIEAARKVEREHASNPAVPVGLASLLRTFQEEMLRHMAKEEQILFPLIRNGARGASIAMPVRVLGDEHDQHTAQLLKIRELTNDLQLPPDACATWRALYEGLAAVEEDLVEHIHLENYVLFAGTLSS